MGEPEERTLLWGPLAGEGQVSGRYYRVSARYYRYVSSIHRKQPPRFTYYFANIVKNYIRLTYRKSNRGNGLPSTRGCF